MSREEQTETGKVNLDAHVAPQELILRTPETPEDAEHRRWKDRWTFVVAILITSILFFLALGTFLLGTPAQRAWAAPALTFMLGGFVGYLTGKNTA